MSKKSIVVGVVFTLVIVAIFVLFVPEKNRNEKNQGEVLAGPYDEFAQCLYSKGMRMYGSVTCSFCARQRTLFGNSFHFVKEIECDPRNSHSEVERCIAKNISHTPTWILEDEIGNDVHRFDPGVISLEKLSEVSECPLPVSP